MPLFNNTGFANLNGTLLVAGIPSYGWGGLATLVATTKFVVTNVSGNGTSVILTGTVTEGQFPTTSQVISTQGLSQITNLTNAAVTAVNITWSSGVGTITATSAQTVSSTPDSGIALLPQVESSEPLVNGASKAFCFAYNDPNDTGARSIRAVVSFPSIPTTATISLQSALIRQDSEFANEVTVVSVVGGVVTGGQAVVTLTPGRWYRFNTTGVVLAGSPPTGTVIAKLMV